MHINISYLIFKKINKKLFDLESKVFEEKNLGEEEKPLPFWNQKIQKYKKRQNHFLK